MKTYLFEKDLGPHKPGWCRSKVVDSREFPSDEEAITHGREIMADIVTLWEEGQPAEQVWRRKQTAE